MEISAFVKSSHPVHEVLVRTGATAQSLDVAASRRERGPPDAILDQLNAEIRKMLADPAVLEKMNVLAFEPIGGSREQFGRFIKAEIGKWTKVARASGAKAD